MNKECLAHLLIEERTIIQNKDTLRVENFVIGYDSAIKSEIKRTGTFN